MKTKSFRARCKKRIFWNRFRYFLAGSAIFFLIAGILTSNPWFIVTSLSLFSPMIISILQDIEWCIGYMDTVETEHNWSKPLK